MQPRVIRITKAHTYLGMNKARFNAEIRPLLPEVKIGRARLVDREDLDRIMEITSAGSSEVIMAQLQVEAKLPETGIVYVIGESSGPVKFGYSGSRASLRVRLHTLQTATHRPLSVLLTISGTVRAERMIHRFLRRSRLHSEWFRRSPEVKRLIQSLENSSLITT